jgi:hypothetical protein
MAVGHDSGQLLFLGHVSGPEFLSYGLGARCGFAVVRRRENGGVEKKEKPVPEFSPLGFAGRAVVPGIHNKNSLYFTLFLYSRFADERHIDMQPIDPLANHRFPSFRSLSALPWRIAAEN